MEQREYVAALTAIRKALFVEIEIEYAIHGWVEAEPDERAGFSSLLRGGRKAHYWTRDKKWISKNVHHPLDYVQISHEQVRLDAMEWGCSTAEIENLFRLTPRVFRSNMGEAWHIEYPVGFQSNQGNLANVRYCLDRAVSILWRKQQHDRARRCLGSHAEMELPEYYLGAPVFESARQDSAVVHRIAKEYEYSVEAVVSGFEPTESYYSIFGHKHPLDSSLRLGNFIIGYLLERKDEAGEPLLPDQADL